MAIELYVENMKADMAEFSVPEMSLSSARSSMERKEFRVEIGAGEVLRLLDEAYKSWVCESKMDDAVCGSPQDALAESGYPELEEVLRDEELLELVVGGYLFDELIGNYSKASATTRYWFDDVVGCICKDAKVSIFGICYTVR